MSHATGGSSARSDVFYRQPQEPTYGHSHSSAAVAASQPQQQQLQQHQYPQQLQAESQYPQSQRSVPQQSYGYPLRQASYAAPPTSIASPSVGPTRYRTRTADGAPNMKMGLHDQEASDDSDKYWDAPQPPPPINGGAMYQQTNASAPQIDGPGTANSRGPPLADDLGFDKLSIAGRSRSPAPSGTAGSGRVQGSSAAVERANAAYANQEIYQSAAEVHPDNSLRAIADEVDQTAAEMNSDALLHQQRVGSIPHASSAAMTNASAYDGMQGYTQQQQQQQQQVGGYDPALYSQASSQGWYGADGQYYDDGQSQYTYGAYPAHHQQAGGYFGNTTPAGPSSRQQITNYDAAGNPYMAAAQGFGLDYPGNSGSGGGGGSGAAYGGYGSGDPLGRAASIGGASLMPGLARQGTQISMASSVHSSGSTTAAARRRSKDAASKGPQQTLPFNKAFVDEYRHRMKGDPDPEAQFAFARYLIEAAKKVQDPKDGPKQARKYRDALLSDSLKLIKRLATTGMGLGKPPYAEAQFFLANCFGNGSLGLQVDHEKAYNLYVQASKQNHAAATYRTAVCNEVGAGTRRDHHRAVLFYRKASALGDTAGMYKLGMILLNGLLGQPRNIREAIVWLKRAAGQADEDNPHALHELGLLYEKPNNNVVPHEEGYARELFTQAAQLGYAPSQFKLGSAYEYGTLTCPVDPRRSIAWYTKAAGKNDGESELALSGWYLTGSDGVLKQSDSEAYLWARRAATKGIPKAEYAVGYYSEVGIGVDSNIEEAKRWYMRAAAQGNKRAMMRLTELKQQKVGAGRKGARPTRKDAEKECIIA